jgi:hypothetical protein
MRALKIALALLALGIGTLATMMTGGFLHVAPAYVGAVMSLGGLVSILGIQPFPITTYVAQVLRAVSVVMTGFVGIHSQLIANAPGGNHHPWIWAAVGFVAIGLGICGKSPITHTPPTADDGPLISPAAKLDQPPPGPFPKP